MRTFILPIFAAVIVANADADAPIVVSGPAKVQSPIPAEYLPCRGTVPVFNPEGCPARPLTTDTDVPPAGNCGDMIELAREKLNQPKLDREPASADTPLLIAAVDKRVDGCAVMQMKGDVNDLRPIPEAVDDPKLQPAR